MREIKFRAWDKKKKKMVYPSRLFGHNAGIPSKLYATEVRDKEGFFYSITKNQIILMQCTGLKDKHGKEIYEGDIVKIIYSTSRMNTPEIIVEQVKFVNGAFMPFYWLREHENYEIDNLINVTKNIQVVGNVFENPELLRKVKQG